MTATRRWQLPLVIVIAVYASPLPSLLPVAFR